MNLVQNIYLSKKLQEVDKLIARMDDVRSRISVVRLEFIETVDKHTEIDQASYILFINIASF